MDKLWAPWRAKYLTSKKPARNKCVFCAALKSGRKGFVLLKTAHSFCVLNIFPYNNGHIMVLPRRHTGKLSGLKDAEVLDLFRTLEKSRKILDRILKPQGYNIGINTAAVAGAGITNHLHIHVVPRWQGDTNFMPVIANTKVISQSLTQLYKKFTEYARSKRD